MLLLVTRLLESESMKLPYVFELLVIPLVASVLAALPLQYAHADTVRIEESNPAIVRTPGWFAVSDGSVSGGRVGASKTPGAYATVYFTGTGIKWIGYRCLCASGAARVWLDGNIIEGILYMWGGGPQTAQAEMYSISGLAPGNHSFTVEVRDYSNTAPYVVVDAFDIENGNVRSPDAQDPPPVKELESPRVTLTSPVYPNNIVTGTVTLTADATDNVGVTLVQFYAGTTLIGSDTTAPYAIERDTSGIPSGSTYSISAVAHDAAGNRGSSQRREVTVDHQDTTRPVVAITAPATGSSMSGTIDVTASASDASGIAQVTFKVDGFMSAQTDTTSPFSVPYDTATWIDGKHTLTAEATDSRGHTGTSQPITLTVSNSVQPGMLRIHDDDPRIAYSGSWEVTNAVAPQTGDIFHWGSARVSSTPGSTASITFTGTGIRWLGLLCEKCAPATVSIDGGAAQQISLFGANSV
ncbi:MAG: Ig-like domain-containing protein, partial [Pseudomonadota bacterium]